MEIIVIHKDELQFVPPVISSCLILSDLGHEITLIDEGVPNYWKKKFKENDIKIVEIPRKKNISRKLSLLFSYYHFKKAVFSYLRRNASSNTLLWIEGGQTINCLGCGIKQYKYILQILELYELKKMQFKAIGKVINEAQTIFMPEYNRTALYQVWFHLAKRPIVLPNKPYFIPGRSLLHSLEQKHQSLLKRINGKKIILYQGYIGLERDISCFVKATKQLGEDFVFVVLGRDCGALEEYKQIDSDIVHIDYLAAPDYLLITSKAYIGILTYIPDSENNIFCAPNKIYEYSAFGLPMIGNDIPGLKILEFEHAGLVVDEYDTDGIYRAIRAIDSNYSMYSEAAKALYEKMDNKKTIENELNRISF